MPPRNLLPAEDRVLAERYGLLDDVDVAPAAESRTNAPTWPPTGGPGAEPDTGGWEPAQLALPSWQ